MVWFWSSKARLIANTTLQIQETLTKRAHVIAEYTRQVTEDCVQIGDQTTDTLSASQMCLSAIPHRSTFPSRNVPVKLRQRIGQALVEEEVNRFFFLNLGYSESSLANWTKTQREDRTFAANQRPAALDEKAIEKGTRLVLEVFQPEIDLILDSVPEGLSKKETVKLLNQLERNIRAQNRSCHCILLTLVGIERD